MKKFQIMLIDAICLTILLGMLVFQPDTEASEKKRLIIIGVRNETDRPEWDNQLIGYGLSNLLSQKLFDTGLYIALEDNPEITEKIENLIRTQWQRESSYYNSEDADLLASDLGSDVTAFAKVTKFSTHRKRGFAGPLSGADTKVIVELEVSLKEKNKPIQVGKGKGEASTRSMGAFFQIREDKVYFDETTVGKAAHNAMDDAINALGVK